MTNKFENEENGATAEGKGSRRESGIPMKSKERPESWKNIQMMKLWRGVTEENKGNACLARI